LGLKRRYNFWFGEYKTLTVKRPVAQLAERRSPKPQVPPGLPLRDESARVNSEHNHELQLSRI